MSLLRRCPLCDTDHARPLWHEAGLRYVRCAGCGCVFSDVDAASYEAGAHNVWHDESVSDGTEAFYGRARLRAHEDFLQRFPAPTANRLLDVGCGLGYFVERAVAAGWQAFGCDTSAEWISRARERAGADRFALGAAGEGLFGARFDMVTAWDVLEHIHDPLPFLRTMAHLLAPGGRVFIRTPNLAWVLPTYALRRRLLNADVELGPLNHVVYYTARTLRHALLEAGMEPVCWPVLPPPQVDIGNRTPAVAGRRSLTTDIKNAHAATAERLAKTSGGRMMLGSDLDVLATLTR